MANTRDQLASFILIRRVAGGVCCAKTVASQIKENIFSGCVLGYRYPELHYVGLVVSVIRCSLILTLQGIGNVKLFTVTSSLVTDFCQPRVP